MCFQQIQICFQKHFLLLRKHRGIINIDNERFSRATKYYGLYADFHYDKEQIKQGKWTWSYKFTMVIMGHKIL